MLHKLPYIENPYALLNKTVVIDFEDEVDTAYVQAVSDEHLEVIVNPGSGDSEFYAELYLSDYGFWKVLEIKD